MGGDKAERLLPLQALQAPEILLHIPSTDPHKDAAQTRDHIPCQDRAGLLIFKAEVSRGVSRGMQHAKSQPLQLKNQPIFKIGLTGKGQEWGGEGMAADRNLIVRSNLKGSSDMVWVLMTQQHRLGAARADMSVEALKLLRTLSAWIDDPEPLTPKERAVGMSRGG